MDLRLVGEQQRDEVRLAVDDSPFTQAVLNHAGVVHDLRAYLLWVEAEELGQSTVKGAEAGRTLRWSSERVPDDPVEFVRRGHGRHGRILELPSGGV
jgi:hypothetical protein